MKKNHVRARLKQGERSIGTWLTLPDPVAAHLMARVGFDWLTVELEHTPISMETAAEPPSPIQERLPRLIRENISSGARKPRVKIEHVYSPSRSTSLEFVAFGFVLKPIPARNQFSKRPIDCHRLGLGLGL